MYFPDNYSEIFYTIKTFAIITFNNSFFMVNKRSINIKIYFEWIQCEFSKNENKQHCFFIQSILFLAQFRIFY